jgi:hypothetical protein
LLLRADRCLGLKMFRSGKIYVLKDIRRVAFTLHVLAKLFEINILYRLA